MGREAEQLREAYYIRCRTKGYTVDEASKRSQTYIKQKLNVSKSSTTTSYLEQQYQESLKRSNVFDTFDDMKENLPPGHSGKGSLYEEDMRERERSVPTSYHVPEYVPSSYDVRPGGDRAPPSARSSRTPLGAYESKSAPRPSAARYAPPSGEQTYRCLEYVPSSYDARPQPSSYNSSGSSSHDSYPIYEEQQPSSGNSSNSSDSGYFFSRPHHSSFSDQSYSSSPPSSSSSHSTPPPRSYHPPPPTGIKPPTDLYTVLNISRGATASEIKKAHRAMSLKWHPDRCQGTDKEVATEKMAEINMANDVLGDEGKRAWYDRWGTLASDVC